MFDEVVQVLSIEDNPLDAELIQEKLEEAQRVGWNLPRFEIEHVARLEEALARLEDGAFDVVLSDLDLPDSRAGETVVTLREHIPHMPLVVLTGREDEALAHKSVRAGVQDYLYKAEVTGSLLARTMMHAIERQQTHDRLEQRVEERTAELQAEVAERKRAEQELRENEEHFRLIAETCTDVVFQLDLEGRLTYCTPSSEQLLGFPPDQVVGTHLTRFFPPSGRAEAMQNFERVIATRETSVLDAEILDSTGAPVPIEAILSPIVKEGEVVGVQGSARDIGGRKYVEEALRRRARDLEAINELAITLTTAPSGVDLFNLLAEELKSITDALGVSVSVYNPDEHVLVVKHVAAEGWVISRLDELLEREIGGLPMPVSEEAYAAMIHEMVRRLPDLHTTTFGVIPEPISAAVQRVLGIDHFIGLALAEGDDLMGTAIIAMPEGQLPPTDEVVETFTRVATAALQKRWAEEALRESEERLDLAVRGGALGTWDWNIQTGEEQFNERWAEMLGYDLEEIRPHMSAWESRVHPDDRSEVYDKLNAHLEGKTPIYEVEFRMRHKSGEWVWILNRGKVIEWAEEGRPLRACGVHLDITARKRAEEQLEHYAAELERSNRDLEHIGYVISHDLQAPLRTVQNWLRLLEKRYRGKLDERAETYIDYAVGGAERMEAMIKALLELSRVETRGEQLTPTDVDAVVECTLDSLKQMVEESDAQITCDPLPTVMADEVQLAQVFQNLVANAIKFRREGVSPRVHISAEREGDAWIFSVEDNGIGVDPEQADRIFQIFQRLHTEEEYSGLGVGLALCQRIVERHGGRIWVESEVGEGSTFYFSLPA